MRIGLSVDKAEQRRLEYLMRELPARVFAKHVAAAASAAMTPVLHAARRRCPKDEGVLRKSLKKKVKKYVRRKTVRAVVGATREAPYAWLVEHGHRMVVGGTAARTGQGRVVGWVPPRPFLRPAFDANVRNMLAVYRRRLAQGLEKEAKILGT